MQNQLNDVRDQKKENQKGDFEMIKRIPAETLNYMGIPEIRIVTYWNIFGKL